jgi:hypothetical protein
MMMQTKTQTQEATMTKLNATATKDTTCHRCNRQIKSGERCLIFRERAISIRQAAAAGTMYPKHRWCSDCAKAR